MTQPETVTERVAVVVMELSNGMEITTRQVAELTGLTRVGAWLLMMRLCRVLPIRYAGEHWSMLTGSN
jgi:alkylated DNA nucleotide flippase Atl1